MVRSTFNAAIAAAFSVVAIGSANAGIVITEVYAAGSGNGTYAADWFELTNTGATAVDITGWKFDDSSAAFATAVAFRGITSIDAGKSVIFLEGNAAGSNDATIATNFVNAWFGGTAPIGFQMGAYGGSGVGLSTGSDAVIIFDAGGTVVTGVQFGPSTTGFSFDNTAGLGSNVPAYPVLSTLSVAGTNGAFLSSNGVETGSPGVTIPTPGAVALLGMGGLVAVSRRRG